MIAKHAIAGAVTATLVALAAPFSVAHADPGDTLRGGCSLDTEPDTVLTVDGRVNGVISDLSLSQEASGGPSGATVECWVQVDGVEAPGTRVVAAGDGVQANAASITFDPGQYDDATLCQQVTFDDGSTWADPNGENPVCFGSAGPQFPPQVVFDTVDLALRAVNGAVGTAEQTIAPVIQALIDVLQGGVPASECARIEPLPNGVNIYIADAATDSAGVTTCAGYKISMTGQSTGQAVHVPKLCVTGTTTATCVGPYDGTAPGADILQSPVEVCDQAMTWSDPAGPGQWIDQPEPGATGDLGCAATPGMP